MNDVQAQDMNDQQVESYNARIEHAVAIMQIVDAVGFKHIDAYLKEQEDAAHFPDVFAMTVKENNVMSDKVENRVYELKGRASLIHDFYKWIEEQRVWADKPRIDPETREMEKMGNKKKK